MKKILGLIITFASGCVCGAYMVGTKLAKILEADNKRIIKENSLASLFTDWVYLNNKGLSIGKWVSDKGYKKVAIYGMSHAGHRLKEDLENAGIEVLYGIDRDTGLYLENFTIYSPEDELPDTELIIVTTLQCFDEIKALLQTKTNSKTEFIKDIFDELLTSLSG